MQTRWAEKKIKIIEAWGAQERKKNCRFNKQKGMKRHRREKEKPRGTVVRRPLSLSTKREITGD